VKLLRALEHNEVMPVGSNQPLATDFRVISATHQNLLQRTAEGLFRHDLLFRLGAYQIDLPPLRDRPGDIAELAAYFISMLTSGPGDRAVGLTTEALAEMEGRAWHGNIRELRNAIEHALIMARGRAILPEHLPPSVTVPAPTRQPEPGDQDVVAAVRRWADRYLGDAALSGRVYEQLLEVIEPPLLEVALQRHRGQCAAAARTLGIHRTTLRKKVVEHGLDDATAAGE
jgi:two-component system nitrogen regulation response regulator GlnG